MKFGADHDFSFWHLFYGCTVICVGVILFQDGVLYGTFVSLSVWSHGFLFVMDFFKRSTLLYCLLPQIQQQKDGFSTSYSRSISEFQKVSPTFLLFESLSSMHWKD